MGVRATGIEHVTAYLSRLQELHFVRRHIPVTVPETERMKSRRGRYVLDDAYMRFYYRFIHPNQHLLEQGLHDLLWQRISEQLRAFIGAFAFEELCRETILIWARAGKLPFIPERVGSHWAPNAQVDVVAINWRQRQILLGEAKWTGKPINRKIVRDLMAKASLVVPDEGKDWQVLYAFFSRSGFTDAALNEAHDHQAIMVDLETLGEVLGRYR